MVPYCALAVTGSELVTAAQDASSLFTVESAGCSAVEGCLEGRDDELASTASERRKDRVEER